VKIYRIAIPIPYEDDINDAMKRANPSDHFTNINSHNLYYKISEEESDRLEKVLADYGYTAPLGIGSFGVAFDIGGGKVAKITYHKEEYENAKKQMSIKSESLVKIFSAEKINESVFLIISEKVNKLNRELFRIYDFGKLYYRIAVKGDVEPTFEGLLKYYSWTPEKIEYKYFVENMFRFLKKLGEESPNFGSNLVSDAHEENVGFRGEDLVLLDLGTL
jgi:hypothetical protein